MEQEQIKERKMIRLLSTDVQGSIPIQKGLTRIKGIGNNLAFAICTRMNINPNKTVGSFTNEEIKELEVKLKAMNVIEPWMLNRQKDYNSGEDKHLLTSDIKLTKQFDLKRLQKTKTYRGLRLAAGLPVRGQRTKAHFRKSGKAVGVKKKGKR